MRVAVVGATGNLGTSVMRRLAAEPEVDSILGLARRVPALDVPKTEWRPADVTRADLTRSFAGADAVIHLAWAIQPSRDPAALRATNVDGTRRLLEALARARVPILAYASSVGAYSPGPKDEMVDEAWATEGVASSFYSRHKSEVESMLDEFERREPGIRVVRMRPGLIFKRGAATEVRRLFLGPFVPRLAFDRRLVPVVPDLPRLRFQAVHSDDVAEAFLSALLRPEANGAYNLAAEPVLDPQRLGSLLGARPVPMRGNALRALADRTWRARLQPTPPGWLDLALAVPLMSSRRAREELDWRPRAGADDALLELLAGMRDGAGLETPPLDPASSGYLRLRELATGVGARAF